MIIRAPHNKDNPFFQMRRATAQDPNLTARALGVLAYLLSKPDDWEPTIEDICRRFEDVGRDQAYRIISEVFIPLRYARRSEERSDGKFARWLTEIYEAPFPDFQEMATPHTENQGVGSDTDFQEVDSPRKGRKSRKHKNIAPFPENQEAVSPFPDLPDTGKPDPVNQEQHDKRKYKLQNKQNTEEKIMSGAPDDIKISSGQVREVFAYWQYKLNHPKALLTADREQKIRARLKEGYTIADIKKGIDGCAASAFHMGKSQNSEGTVYDDIELICRKGSKLESFMAKAPQNGNGNGAHAIPRQQYCGNCSQGWLYPEEPGGYAKRCPCAGGPQ
jgi:hypothetical protein